VQPTAFRQKTFQFSSTERSPLPRRTPSTMSAISANSAVFARKALAGARVTAKRTAVNTKAAFRVSANARVDKCDKNSVIVSPSILSANFATLGAEVRDEV